MIQSDSFKQQKGIWWGEKKKFVLFEAQSKASVVILQGFLCFLERMTGCCHPPIFSPGKKQQKNTQITKFHKCKSFPLKQDQKKVQSQMNFAC